MKGKIGLKPAEFPNKEAVFVYEKRVWSFDGLNDYDPSHWNLKNDTKVACAHPKKLSQMFVGVITMEGTTTNPTFFKECFLKIKDAERVLNENLTEVYGEEIEGNYFKLWNKRELAKKGIIGDSGHIAEELLEGVPKLWLSFHAAAGCVKDKVFSIEEAYNLYMKKYESAETENPVLERNASKLEEQLKIKTTAIDDLITEGCETFGKREKFALWLLSPIRALENRRPLDVLTEENGVQDIRDILGRINWGVYS